MIRCRHLLLPIILILFTGCATYSQRIDKATAAFRSGDYEFAGKEIEKELDAERHKLLRLMELGVIYHEWEKYEESNRFLEEAYQLAESFYGVSVQELLLRIGTKADMRPYRSEVFEKIYIHYYKILNYTLLARKTKERGERQKLLDSVRVEARRAELLLGAHEAKVGSYADAKERNQHVLAKLIRFFELLNGETIHSRDYIFRNNAFLHYMMGVVYEEYGELDNARISYEKSATIYAEGYVKQYQLDPKMTDQAYFDAARILKSQKDNRWQELAQKIKDASLRKSLESYKPAKEGSLLILQEVDMSSPKGELNLYMRLNLHTERLEIYPIPLGSPEERNQQAVWFYSLYAPRGILDIIQIIRNEKSFSLDAKTIFVRGILPIIKDVEGLTEALETGVRLTVPMYYYKDAPFNSTISVDGRPTGPMMDADNITALHLSNALASAKNELTESMAVETFKLSACVMTGLPPEICSILTSGTNSADTRSWLTLPHSIRVQRLFLPAGSHEITILNHSGSHRSEVSSAVELEAGKQEILRIRSMKP
ncbi:hypothetical protein LJC24_04695 [Desulfococcaceae bacterium OttesenSCG-928-F15]|nr:hypothetical protein [Desulfococcaceae bacterium OttesenSCG-928-F15]